MRPKSCFTLGLSLFAFAFSVPAQRAPSKAALPIVSAARLDRSFAKLPLAFEPNRGQTDPSVQFLAHSPQATIYLTGADAVLETSSVHPNKAGRMESSVGAVVRMHLVDASEHPDSLPEQLLPGKVNYLTGRDRSNWQQNLPMYSGVRMSHVYPGIDLRYYGHTGTLEYDFDVAPGADPSTIALSFDGAKTSIGADGNLHLAAGADDSLRFDRPIAYQQIDGRRMQVEVSYLQSDRGDVRFHLGAYDHSRKLVIDPTLVYLGTLGTGTYPAHTNLSQIMVDAAGEMYFIGTTNDPNFPVTSGAYQKVCGPTKGNRDQVTYYGGYCPSGGGGEQAAFVAKLSADGTQLLYATYLSGQSGTEQGTSIAVDSAGVAYLLGTTASDDFPVTTDAFQKNCYAYYGVFGGPNIVNCDGYYNGGGTEYTLGNQDAFFAKLSADGSSLLYSSFLGGTAPVYPNTIALDSTGNIYISGQVAVFDASALTGCQSCGPNSQGQLQFTGITSSGYLTLATALNGDGNPAIINTAAFLSKFSNDGHTLLYGTFFGDNTSAVDVVPTTMAVGQNGIAFLGGQTPATNFPTTAGAIKSACTQANGSSCDTVDGFVAAIDTTKSGAASLVYSTRLGGTTATQGSNINEQQVLGITVDGSNDAFVTGYTFDSTFGVGTTGFQSTCPNNTGNIAPTASGYIDRCNSAFLLKIDPTGTKILAGTFLSGPDLRSAGSVGYVVRLDSRGQVYLYGLSDDGGGDFPQVNPLQSYKGGNQLFISTFTPDLSKLLFSTRFGNPSYTDHSVGVAGGLAIDGSDNVYFAGTTTDVTFATTAGTYATPGPTGDQHAFFAKLSKVLEPVTATLTLSPATSAEGQTITYTLAVAGLVQTTPAPTGTVTLQYTSSSSTTPVTIGTATLNGSGNATYTAAAPTAGGSYTVTATYSGESVYDVATSSAATLTVNNIAATTTTLSTSAASAASGVSVTFTAKVASNVSGSPTGTVAFFDGTTQLGTATLASGSASYSTSSLSVATHSITAVYSGDSNFATSTSNAVQQTITAATVALTASPTSLTVTRGSSGTITITATPTGAYTGTMTFACGTLPQDVQCSFAPSTLAFNASSTNQSSTLTISTAAQAAALEFPQGSSRRDAQVFAAMFGLPAGLLLVFARRRKLVSRIPMLLLFFAMTAAALGIAGCGGSGSSTNKAAPGSYTVQVVGSVNGAQSSTLNLNITVQ